MSDRADLLSAAALSRGALTLAGIASRDRCAAAFAKAKAKKEDFYFQETPDDDTAQVHGLHQFHRKSAANTADSGDCALLEGDVCVHCYCQGWTDKNAPGSRGGRDLSADARLRALGR